MTDAGTLTDEQRAELDAHLAECDACRALCALYAGPWSGGAADPPAALKENVMAAVRAAVPPKKPIVTPMVRRWIAAAACFAVVLLAGLAGARLLGGRITADKSAEAAGGANSGVFPAGADAGTEYDLDAADNAVPPAAAFYSADAENSAASDEIPESAFDAEETVCNAENAPNAAAPRDEEEPDEAFRSPDFEISGPLPELLTDFGAEEIAENVYLLRIDPDTAAELEALGYTPNTPRETQAGKREFTVLWYAVDSSGE